MYLKEKNSIISSMMTNILGWCFLLLPLVTLKRSYDAFEYPKVMVFIILINLILAINFWGLIQKFKKSFKLNKVDKLLITLILLLVISWAINGFSTIGFWGQYYRYEGLVTMMTYLIFYFFVSRLSEPKKIQNFIATSGLFYSFYILISGILFNVFHRPVYTFDGRAAGTFGNPNFAAGFLALSFPYLFNHHKIKPIFKILIIPLFLSALLFTQSRSGLIAFLIVLFLSLIKKYKYGLAVVIPLLILSLLLLFKFIPRYSPFNNQLVVWQKAVVALQKKPLFGWGIENFDVAFQQVLIPNKDFDLYHIRVDKAHNETLEYGVTGGILAMLVYLVLVISCFKIFWQKRKEKWYWTNFLALSAYLVLSQLNVLNITEYIFFYFMLAVASRIENKEIIF